MKKFMLYVIAAGMAILAPTGMPSAQAQISFSIGVAPACPYGYFDYEPYGCAPYGYYGQEWFRRGAFIGVGPWFHGSANFSGHVNNSLDPRNGYQGYRPSYGDTRTERRLYPRRFNGNELRDGRGQTRDMPRKRSRR